LYFHLFPSDSYKETKSLRKEIAELKKENDFLKKVSALFTKEIERYNIFKSNNTFLFKELGFKAIIMSL